MAIPFNLPSDEETEDNYRRLDQLLMDLYHLLRQILLRSTNTDGGGGEGAPATAPSRSRPVDDVSHPRRHRLDPNLPDVVSSTLDCHCQSSRRRQRRHRRRRNCCQNQELREQNHQRQNSTSVAQVPRPDVPRLQTPQTEENWLVMGEHLRKIAEEFKTSLRKEQCPKEKQQDLKLEVKTSGLFSLLVPTHFRHSLWTTVILLVGWRILARAR